MLDTTLNARIQVFLDKFDAALAAGGIDAAVAMFAPECYWRDLVAFAWNIRTMEGRDQVREMLSSCLAHVSPRHWKSRTCRNSRAWKPSRVSSTILRAIQAPTATRARGSS